MNDIYYYDIQWILSVVRETADNSPYTNISPQKYSIIEILFILKQYFHHCLFYQHLHI